MTIENDFLTFACASGANVEDQADYAVAPSTAGGFATGTASSALVNKTLRQTSIMAAMLAQFIVSETSRPVVDDGTTATIETNFIAAILAVAETMNITIPQVAGLTAALAGLLPIGGNAVSASRLAAARNIALSGVVTGAVNFDGSGNVVINTASTLLAALSGAAFSGNVSTAGTLSATGNISTAGDITCGQFLEMTFGGNSAFCQMNAGGIASFGLATSSAIPFVVSIDGSIAMELAPGGSLSIAGNLVAAGTVRGGSDERVKDSPEKITGALDTVRVALVGNTYHRNDQGGILEAGFIAQRVREHLPHLVGIEPEVNGLKDFHTMDYMHTAPYLANAIVELHDMVLSQAKLIDQLISDRS